jgi:hypothetical protein
MQWRARRAGSPIPQPVPFSFFPTDVTYPKGQQVAAVSLPLVFFNPSDGTARPIPKTLQISARCTGGTNCLTTTAFGNISGDIILSPSAGDGFLPRKSGDTLLGHLPHLRLTEAADDAKFINAGGEDRFWTYGLAIWLSPD